MVGIYHAHIFYNGEEDVGHGANEFNTIVFGKIAEYEGNEENKENIILHHKEKNKIKKEDQSVNDANEKYEKTTNEKE